MKKKLFLTLIFITFLISCGKKADPEYKGFLDRSIIQNKIIKPTVPTNVKVVDFTDKPKSNEKIKVKYF